MIGIYKITSPTGKIYIGQSWNIENRFSTYKNVLCPEQSALYNSLRKYGSDNHVFDIIYEFPKDITQDILDNYEIFCIAQYREGKTEILNIRDGGSRGKYINGFTEEHKRKISEYHTGKKLSMEHKEKISKSLIGNKRTLGFKPSEETRIKLRARKPNRSMLGKKHTEETRRKMSASSHKVRKPHSDESKHKMSVAKKGEKVGYRHSLETIEKMKKTATGRRCVNGKWVRQINISYSFGFINVA